MAIFANQIGWSAAGGCMDVGKIIVGEGARPVRDYRIDHAAAWKALAWFALLFVSVGLVDMALVVISTDMSGPITRMAAFAGMSTGLPLLTIGVIGFLMSGIGARSRAIVLSATVLSGLLLVAVIIGIVLLLTSTGAAFSNAPPNAHAAMRQGLLRGLVFYGVFGGALAVSAITGLRVSRGAVET
jgi:hypothetical protein